MTGMSSSIFLSSSSAEMPSIPGIIMSRIAASNGTDRARSSSSAAGGEAHVVAFARQHRLQDFPQDVLVVDDQDARAVSSAAPRDLARGSLQRPAPPPVWTEIPRRPGGKVIENCAPLPVVAVDG